MKKTKAILALENGKVFKGYAIGATEIEGAGEVVFNTAMSGYQEVLTDPSYKGQIVTFTSPHIGNYGVNLQDVESGKVQVEGIVVHELSKVFSNFRASISLDEYLKKYNITGIEGIDTRALVRMLRDEGAMRGIITTDIESPEKAVERARAIPSMDGLDLSGDVMSESTFVWRAAEQEDFLQPADTEENEGKPFKVAAMDFGIKQNILRRLAMYGCDVTVFPATTSAEEILKSNPDGIFISNGPGDPAAIKYAVETIQKLVNEKPTFGICLGHQLLGLAFGAKTYKLKFGHHGVNHPVKNLMTGKIEVTSQNHGFAVDVDTLPNELEPTHINLNDNTLSGMRHKTLPVISVQYHPEAAPGPHDSDYLFKEFVRGMAEARAKKS
jgi:carbamoyl-phosphate synthase small subunit